MSSTSNQVQNLQLRLTKAQEKAQLAMSKIISDKERLNDTDSTSVHVTSLH